MQVKCILVNLYNIYNKLQQSWLHSPEGRLPCFNRCTSAYGDGYQRSYFSVRTFIVLLFLALTQSHRISLPVTETKAVAIFDELNNHERTDTNLDTLIIITFDSKYAASIYTVFYLYSCNVNVELGSTTHDSSFQLIPSQLMQISLNKIVLPISQIVFLNVDVNS